jgi:Ala-tRNA(Pro) deacylase
MGSREGVLYGLRAMGIPYALHEHPAVLTMADCLGITGIAWDTTEMCKNVFLCNRQETQFYLLLLRHDAPFRTAAVSKALGVSRLSFAREALLPAMLGLTAGAVSPLGLIYDTQARIRLLADEGLKAYANLAFHPCDNTATVVLRAGDFWDVFIKQTLHEVTYVMCESA